MYIYERCKNFKRYVESENNLRSIQVMVLCFLCEKKFEKCIWIMEIIIFPPHI